MSRWSAREGSFPGQSYRGLPERPQGGRPIYEGDGRVVWAEDGQRDLPSQALGAVAAMTAPSAAFQAAPAPPAPPAASQSQGSEGLVPATMPASWEPFCRLDVDALIRQNDIEAMRPYLDSLLFGDLSPLADPRAHAACFQVARAQQVFAQYLTLAENSAREELELREAELRQSKADALDYQQRIREAEKAAGDARKGAAAVQKLQAATEAAGAAGQTEIASLRQQLADADEKLQEALRQASSAQDKASRAIEENRLLRQKLEAALERQERADAAATQARAETRQLRARAEKELLQAREDASRAVERARAEAASLGAAQAAAQTAGQADPHLQAELSAAKAANASLTAQNARLKGALRDLAPLVSQLPSCPVCTRRFMNEAYLRAHIMKRHPDVADAVLQRLDRPSGSGRPAAGQGFADPARSDSDPAERGRAGRSRHRAESTDSADNNLKHATVGRGMGTGGSRGSSRRRARRSPVSPGSPEGPGMTRTKRTTDGAIRRKHGGRYQETEVPGGEDYDSRSSSASSRDASSSVSEVEINLRDVRALNMAGIAELTKIEGKRKQVKGDRGDSNARRRADSVAKQPRTSPPRPKPEPKSKPGSEPASKSPDRQSSPPPPPGPFPGGQDGSGDGTKGANGSPGVGNTKGGQPSGGPSSIARSSPDVSITHPTIVLAEVHHLARQKDAQIQKQPPEPEPDRLPVAVDIYTIPKPPKFTIPAISDEALGYPPSRALAVRPQTRMSPPDHLHEGGGRPWEEIDTPTPVRRPGSGERRPQFERPASFTTAQTDEGEGSDDADENNEDSVHFSAVNGVGGADSKRKRKLRSEKEGKGDDKGGSEETGGADDADDAEDEAAAEPPADGQLKSQPAASASSLKGDSPANRGRVRSSRSSKRVLGQEPSNPANRSNSARASKAPGALGTPGTPGDSQPPNSANPDPLGRSGLNTPAAQPAPEAKRRFSGSDQTPDGRQPVVVAASLSPESQSSAVPAPYTDSYIAERKRRVLEELGVSPLSGSSLDGDSEEEDEEEDDEEEEEEEGSEEEEESEESEM